MNEKRLHERVPLKTRIYFEDEFGEPLIWFESSDISLGGILLVGSIPIRIGSQSFLSFELNGEKISATAQVVRVPQNRVGLRFLGLSKKAEEKIKNYITS